MMWMCCFFQPSLEDAHLHSPDVEFFEAELVKGTQGLGITIAGYIGEQSTGEYHFANGKYAFGKNTEAISIRRSVRNSE